MKKTFKSIIFIFLFCLNSLANSSELKAYAVGVFDKNGNGENIQHLRISKSDYNGTCFSKVVIFGNYKQKDIKVSIGKSIGHFLKKDSIYNSKKIKIAEELTFKHYNISKGYFEIKINNKLYDSKVFIK